VLAEAASSQARAVVHPSSDLFGSLSEMLSEVEPLLPLPQVNPRPSTIPGSPSSRLNRFNGYVVELLWRLLMGYTESPCCRDDDDVPPFLLTPPSSPKLDV
jgi:hypothetical protein